MSEIDRRLVAAVSSVQCRACDESSAACPTACLEPLHCRTRLAGLGQHYLAHSHHQANLGNALPVARALAPRRPRRRNNVGGSGWLLHIRDDPFTGLDPPHPPHFPGHPRPTRMRDKRANERDTRHKSERAGPLRSRPISSLSVAFSPPARPSARLFRRPPPSRRQNDVSRSD